MTTDEDAILTGFSRGFADNLIDFYSGLANGTISYSIKYDDFNIVLTLRYLGIEEIITIKEQSLLKWRYGTLVKTASNLAYLLSRPRVLDIAKNYIDNVNLLRGNKSDDVID